MSRLMRTMLITILVMAAIPLTPAAAQEMLLPPYCQEGIQASGAYYFICVPPVGWNGDLVVFAHGYVSPELPVGGYPWDQLVLPDGTSLVAIVNGTGYAFAASGYSKNGLAVLQGLTDSLELVNIFESQYIPRYIYLVGASEGGLITTLGVERYPDVFDGGLTTCGPVGDFSKQINYWGDFRVVFDYFFPKVLPGRAVTIPDALINKWETVYAPKVVQAVSSHPARTSQLLSVTGAPIDPANPASTLETVLGLLWYNVYATNDGVLTLGGQPFDNSTTKYTGSLNDVLLNRKVKRFIADPIALAEIGNYQTSGVLGVPLVSLHTTGDPIVPYWHTLLYDFKVQVSGSSLRYTNIPVLRYGHCNFNQVEVLVAFGLLISQTSGQPLTAALDVLPDTQLQAAFIDMAQEYGAWR